MGPAKLGTRLGLCVLLGAVVPACATGPVGLTLHRDSAGGQSRTWEVYQPPGLPSRAAPLLVVLHGLGETPADIAAATGLDVEARRDRFVIAYPIGVGRSWDAGTCCGAAGARRVDDLGYIAGVVATLVGSGRVDPHRVFVVGFSNGAMMAWALACNRPGLFAGVAAVEGTLMGSCPGHRPLDLLVVHQRADAVVPFSGTPTPDPRMGATSGLMPVETALGAWLPGEGCTAPPEVLPSTLVQPFEQDTYDCPGPSRTLLVLLDGGSHTWPRSTPPGVDATSLVTAFFGLGRGTATVATVG